jgi:hypothetical protein
VSVTEREPDIDLGGGRELRWASWAPDRKLNPQYEGLPDIEKFCALIKHPLRPDDDQEFCRERGFCEGAAQLDGETARQIAPGRALWQVISMDPLTLSPSILCHCGEHGMIRDGIWVNA